MKRTKKMKTKIKKLWMSALTSGEYRQDHGSLRNGYGYCCLGVLCDLYRKDKSIKSELKGSWNRYYTEFRIGKGADVICESSYLPKPVQKWAGLTSENPVSLAKYNDDGKSFEQIAKIIETKL